MLQSLVARKFDVYTRRARIAPCLIAFLPVLVTVFAIFPQQYAGLGGIAGLLSWGSITALLAETSRELGKRKQPGLYKQWQGKPTTKLLRHRNAPNEVTLRRRHAKLEQCISDIKIPTALEERANPKLADDIYEECTAFLRRYTTRHRDEYPLVFEELCNYGFRRNLWGMKPIGITASVVGTITIGIFIAINWISGTSSSTLSIAGGVVNLAMLLAWLLLVNPEWVKTVADAYAERLMETCEHL